MIIPDANILLYAYDSDSPHHEKSVLWVQAVFSGVETIGLPWQTIHAFLRVRTNLRILLRPTPPEESLGIVREWLALPGVVVVQPGPRHAALLEKLMAAGNAYGPMVSDAVIAALAIEYGSVLASTDRGFSRFPDLRWINPLD